MATDQPLAVTIEATALPPRLTGVGVYLAHLIPRLAVRDDLRLEARVSPRSPAASVLAPTARTVAITRLGRPARIAWTQLGAGRAARTAGAHLLHGIHHELPLRTRVATCVTVHDLTMLTHPEWHEPVKVKYFGWALRRAVRTANRVLCVSATTARDLSTLLDIAPDRIDVTPLGTDLRPANDQTVADVRDRLGLQHPYILGLGTLEPRKNLPALIRAFAALAEEIPHRLVLAGLAGWGTTPITDAVRATGLADRILLPGYVAESDKPALFTGAEVFVYPSRYEGFGLPVLEAMACGTPVITTTGGSLPEVAGTAAMVVDPDDIDGLAVALRSVLDDESTRATLTAAGRDRASLLTWEHCAGQTAAAYHRAVSSDG